MVVYVAMLSLDRYAFLYEYDTNTCRVLWLLDVRMVDRICGV
jgi:hypothetical protein